MGLTGITMSHSSFQLKNIRLASSNRATHQRRKAFIVFVITLLLSACSSVPKAIKVAPFDNLTSFTQATLDENSALIGSAARWGGKIVSVKNDGDISHIEVVLFSLDLSGRPRIGDYSLGRFKATIPALIDPETPSEGRLITVLGTLGKPVSAIIGEQPYEYQVINADGVYLWADDNDSQSIIFSKDEADQEPKT